MCIGRRNLDPKTRRFLAFGNLCLAIGLSLPFLGKCYGLRHHGWFDGLSGFLLGISLVFIVYAFRRSRRCSEKQLGGSPQ